MASSLQDLPFYDLDDESFRLSIYEINNGPVRYSPDRLNSLYFNPINTENFTRNTFDIDPDQQFFSAVDSPFFIQDQFNEIISIQKSSFSLLHLNIRSMNQNLHKLTDFLNT